MWKEKELLKHVIELFSLYEPFLLGNTPEYLSLTHLLIPALISWAMSAYNPVSHSKNWGMAMAPCKHKPLVSYYCVQFHQKLHKGQKLPYLLN